MGYLQLAENPYSHLAESIPTDVRELYVFVPKGYKGSTRDQYIREDLFDKLPEPMYRGIMAELAPYQNTGLSGKAADRKAARQAQKQANKDKRMAARETRSERRASMFEGLTTKAGDLVKSLTGGDTATRGYDIGVTGGDGTGLNVDFSQTGDQSFFAKNKIPLIIGGVAAVGTIVYLATRKKRK